MALLLDEIIFIIHTFLCQHDYPLHLVAKILATDSKTCIEHEAIRTGDEDFHRSCLRSNSTLQTNACSYIWVLQQIVKVNYS